MSERIERSKDGVPQWDGSAATFQEYSEVAEHWEQTIPHHKRYLCGPKLLNELSGTARRFVLSKRPQWVSHDGGVQTLLTHLRRHLGLPQLSEMSDFMAKYFKQSRRKRNETMNEYVTRKAELYSRAEQTLRRAQGRYGQTKNSKTSDAQGTLSWWGRDDEPHHTSEAGREAPQDHDSPEQPQEDPEEDEADDPGQESHQESGSQGWDEWQWDDPWRQWARSSYGQSNSWHTWSYTAASTTASSNTEITLLPDFVQGWFLLQDAGLDTSEKNMIMAALKGNFTLVRVAQELRNQWPDEELRRHDQGSRNTAWWADEPEPTDPFAGDHDSPDMACLIQSGMNAEGMALINEAETDAQQALALVEKGRRTLREARAKQHYVKLSRQYYGQPHRFSAPGRQEPFVRRETSANAGTTKCLSCGGHHRTQECPQKTKTQHASSVNDIPQEQAPFICMTDQVLTADTAMGTYGKPTTHEARARQWWMVVPPELSGPLPPWSD